MEKIMKEYKCDRCGRMFKSYMTYSEKDIKICGQAGCWNDRNIYAYMKKHKK